MKSINGCRISPGMLSFDIKGLSIEQFPRIYHVPINRFCSSGRDRVADRVCGGMEFANVFHPLCRIHFSGSTGRLSGHSTLVSSKPAALCGIFLSIVLSAKWLFTPTLLCHWSLQMYARFMCELPQLVQRTRANDFLSAKPRHYKIVSFPFFELNFTLNNSLLVVVKSQNRRHGLKIDLVATIS